jgi:UV DNA damage endonuclease
LAWGLELWKFEKHIFGMDRLVLLDNAFTFWRVAATMSWYARAHPDSQPSLDNVEFMGRLESQYMKSLGLVCRAIGVQSPKDIVLVRDCPNTEIWRQDHYPEYKSNRSGPSAGPSKYGPYIKHLNSIMCDQYKMCLRVPRCEADDVIAVLVKYWKFRYPKSEIVIVANDNDFIQLMQYSGVRIFNPKTSEWLQVDNPLAALAKKIESGDRCDGIPSSVPMHLKRLLIDLSCIPRGVQDSIIAEYRLGTKCIQFSPQPIQLGLCCMNTSIKTSCSSTVRLESIKQANCQALLVHLEWNAKHGIRVFRISSDMFPHKSNPEAPAYTFDFAHDLLVAAGRYARATGQRLTFHPGQYNVVGTPKEDIFHKTVLDLDWHAEVLDIMGCPPDSVMVVHAGGIYNDKEATKRRWITNYYRLPERVQRRLVLENCEKAFSIVDCLDVSCGWTTASGEKIPGCGVPVVLDIHHFDCYQKSHTEKFNDIDYYIPAVLETWAKKHIKPKMHISEQDPAKQLGAHSDLISHIPNCLLDIPAKYGVSIDIMIEAKLKEQAIEKLWKVHPHLNPSPSKLRFRKKPQSVSM